MAFFSKSSEPIHRFFNKSAPPNENFFGKRTNIRKHRHKRHSVLEEQAEKKRISPLEKYH
jgi:hypothetical protein